MPFDFVLLQLNIKCLYSVRATMPHATIHNLKYLCNHNSTNSKVYTSQLQIQNRSCLIPKHIASALIHDKALGMRLLLANPQQIIINPRHMRERGLQ